MTRAKKKQTPLFELETPWTDRPLLYQERKKAAQLGPLSATEAASLERGAQAIRDCSAVVRSHTLQNWALGRALLEAYETRYWLRDPRYSDLTFMQFAREVAQERGCATLAESTLSRRMHLAKGYTEEEIRFYGEQGCAPRR